MIDCANALKFKMEIQLPETADSNGNAEANEDSRATNCDSRLRSAGCNRYGTLCAKYMNRILPDFPTPSERYFDIRVMSGTDRSSWFGEVGDQCIMFHSNKVCLICLAPTHDVITQDKTVSKIDYRFEGYENIDRVQSKPQGKSKKGCQKMHKNSPVCAMHCSDGTKYVITACMNSRLLEVNERIVENPELVKRYPLSRGFIAITQPNNWKLMNEIKDSLPKLGS